jgi:DNA end-binding protein Ku
VPQREGARRRRARLEGGEESAAPEQGATGRAIWSGSITFGLVTVPIELYTARRRGGAPLRMLSPEGVPLARQYVCSAEGTPLEADEIVRGYEVAPGEFVLVTDEELEALAPRRSRDIELARFVDRGAIDPGHFQRAYFLVPGGEQTKAYRLLAETMERTGRAAIASFVMRDKAYAVAIFADGGVLRAQTLRFGDELRSPDALGLPAAAQPDAARVKRMARAIDALARDELDEAELQDDADERLLALARAKRERGEDVVEAPTAAAPADASEGADAGEGGEVVDLMALLKQRLGVTAGGARAGGKTDREPSAGDDRAAGRDRKPARRAGSRRSVGADATRQELLARARELDIAGRSKMSRAELARAIRRAG